MEPNNTLSREVLLELPVSINSYIVLRDYIIHHADRELYKKFILQYKEVCPGYEMARILELVNYMFYGEDPYEIIGLVFT
ncbi:MAG: hypothetical protein LUE65_01285 [Clostridiales bacterium]|nr:hypothetical protein [Clostridiales bacterium]